MKQASDVCCAPRFDAASIQAQMPESAEELQQRGGRCRLFSRLFAAPPGAALLEDVRALGWIEAEEKTTLENLQVEFTRLLSSPGPDAVPAHQSQYTDTLRIEHWGRPAPECWTASSGREFQGYLGGKSCSEVRHWYEAADFKPDDPAPAMADHISTQLAFLAHLYLLQARALEEEEAGDAEAFGELRSEFYARFPGRWAGAFSEKLASNTVSKFYGRIGRLLRIVAAGLLSRQTEANSNSPATERQNDFLRESQL